MRTLRVAVIVAVAATASMLARGEQKTRNVIFVMTDGARWQDAFRGADKALMNKQSGVEDVGALKREFWRDSAPARREALMPFLWTVIAKQGQVYGNRDRGSDAYVTNGMNFSYPGYSEILCGFPDNRIDSNDKNENPNASVLEWLQSRPGYKGRIAAFGAWDLFPYILNVSRSGLMVSAGYDPLRMSPMTPQLELLNRIKIETGIWDGEALDAPAFYTALEYLKAKRPRVLYMSLGDTDEWAHSGRYDLYLKSLHRVDEYVRQLWETVQQMPEYRGSTSLILGVDHGRGTAPKGWRSHGKKVPDSKYVWMAFLGPDTPALGERSNIKAVTQSQVAATVAALLGEDYADAVPKAGKPIADVVRQ